MLFTKSSDQYIDYRSRPVGMFASMDQSTSVASPGVGWRVLSLSRSCL